jgi:hypothetical protein
MIEIEPAKDRMAEIETETYRMDQKPVTRLAATVALSQ